MKFSYIRYCWNRIYFLTIQLKNAFTFLSTYTPVPNFSLSRIFRPPVEAVSYQSVHSVTGLGTSVASSSCAASVPADVATRVYDLSNFFYYNTTILSFVLLSAFGYYAIIWWALSVITSSSDECLWLLHHHLISY